MDKLDSDAYISRALVPLVAFLAAKEKGEMCLPLELLVTDAEGDLVSRYEIKDDEHIKGLEHPKDLRDARPPFTVTATDRNGKTWSTELSEDLIQ